MLVLKNDDCFPFTKRFQGALCTESLLFWQLAIPQILICRTRWTCLRLQCADV